MGRFFLLIGFCLSLSAIGAPQGLEKFRGDWIADPCGRQISEGRDCPNPLYVQEMYREGRHGVDLLTYRDGKRDGMYTAFDRASFSTFGFLATCSWVFPYRICHHTTQPSLNRIVHRRSIRTGGVIGSGDEQTLTLSQAQNCTKEPIERLTYSYSIDGKSVQQCVYIRP